MLDVARLAWRVDVDLRPEGRDGPLTRSLDSYEAYWDRWAKTWEFQALLKARPVAGDSEVGQAFMAAAIERIWARPFGAEELRAVRAMKARAEGDVARRGLSERELKRGPGGIRDIEFAVQLLQLVHGRADPDLRSPTTLSALGELAAAGYVAAEDASALEKAYRFLRATEHRLQLVEDQQVHALPDRGRRAGPTGPGDGLPRRRRGHRGRPLRRGAAPPSGHGPDHPSAPLLPAPAGGVHRWPWPGRAEPGSASGPSPSGWPRSGSATPTAPVRPSWS